VADGAEVKAVRAERRAAEAQDPNQS